MAVRCSFFSGLLFDILPKASKMTRTSTPSFAFTASRSKSALPMESLRKLKYSMCMLLVACLSAANISSNFSCPHVSRVTLLFFENVMFCCLRVRAISVSELSLHAPTDSAESNSEIMINLL